MADILAEAAHENEPRLALRLAVTAMNVVPT